MVPERKLGVFLSKLEKRLVETNLFRHRHHAVLVTSYLRKRNRFIYDLRKAKQGKTCFILGNGPSLNELDLDRIRSFDSFAFNGIFLKFPQTKYRPTYYIVEDALVANDRASEISKLSDCTKFYSKNFSNIIQKDRFTQYINVAYNYESYFDFPDFSFDASRLLWVGGSVSYLALQMALYFGYSCVVLVGFDHSYKVLDEDNEKKGNELTSKVDDVNHFDPNYFGKGYRWHVPRVDRMELGFQKARKAYEFAGTSIYNGTAGGNLEVFERIDVDEFLKSKNC